MILRTHGAPGARQVSRLLVLLCVLLAAPLAIIGCGGKGGGKEGGKEPATAVNDTTAYRDARAVPDTTARIAAWEAFLKNYPESPFRSRVVGLYSSLLLARDPAKLDGFVAKALQTEQDPATRGALHNAAYDYAQARAVDRLPAVLKAMRDDPKIDTDACGSVAWDLVERNQFLDDAIALAAIGVQKAPDDQSKAAILDTQGWAHFTKGEFPQAVELLVQANDLDKENPESQLHLAQAFDKAGRAREALEAYTKLLIPAEDPAVRERVAALSQAGGEPAAAVFKRIDQAREANAKPAATFTLKDYAGKELAFADTKGKVVLLNFWYPT